MTVRSPAYSWVPVIVAGVAGLLMAVAMFFYDLPLDHAALFALGLFLTYLSIGVLVAILPRFGPNWFFGTAVGFLYSIPGSVLVAVPYPLREDSNLFYRNFAAGGIEEFLMTMVYGMIVGLLAGLSLRRR